MEIGRKYASVQPRRKPLSAAFALIAASHAAVAANVPAVPAPSSQAVAALTTPVLDDRSWTPEQRTTFKKVEDDLHKNGIASATYLYPFPERTWPTLYTMSRDGQKIYEGFYAEVINGGPSVLAGIAEQGRMREFAIKPPNLTFACDKKELISPDFFEVLRIFDYIHETAHRIAYQRHLTDQLKKDINEMVDAGFARAKNPTPERIESKKEWKADLAANIDERQADVTLALYFKANLPQFDKEFEYHRARRITDVLTVHDHNVSSSIDAAFAAYDKAPRPNLSIVEAAEWARDILAGQKQTLLSDYLINTGVTGMYTKQYGQMSKGTADQVDADVQQRYNLIRETEKSLCNMQPRP
jgi:hypothetical protein